MTPQLTMTFVGDQLTVGSKVGRGHSREYGHLEVCLCEK